MNINKIVFTFFFSLCLFLYTSLFIVNDGQRAVILKFGKIEKDNKKRIIFYNPGLHIKIPYFDSVKMFDFRLQNVNNYGKWFTSKDKKKIYVDAYLKWKIINFDRFYAFSLNLNEKNLVNLLINKFNKILTYQINCLKFNQLRTNLLFLPFYFNQNSLLMNKKLGYKYYYENNDFKLLGMQIIDIGFNKVKYKKDQIEKFCCHTNHKYKNIINNYRNSGKEQSKKIKFLAHIHATKILTMAKYKLIILKYIMNKKLNERTFSH